MSQINASQAPVRQSHHILIVDDSARLRYALADLIIAACVTTGKPYRVFHCDKDGRFTQSQESLNPAAMPAPSVPEAASDPHRLDEFAIYTAPSPKHALFVINSPLFTRLTIICDVMMPADTEVGLVGMLEAISRRNLPVNLVFASSDAQNRYVVANLVEAGKAYFVIKAGGVWEELAQALVMRTDSFQFKTIAPSDFAGIGGAASYAMGAQPLPNSTNAYAEMNTATVAPRLGSQAAVTNPPAPPISRPITNGGVAVQASAVQATPATQTAAKPGPFQGIAAFFRSLFGGR